jgi:hypothetical protein
LREPPGAGSPLERKTCQMCPFADPIDPYHTTIGWWEDLGLGVDEFVEATE